MNDLIERQTAIDEISRWLGYLDDDMILRIQIGLRKLPPAQPVATDTNVGDKISRQQAIDALDCISGVEEVLRSLPSAQSKTCEGCKHLGKWENEVEYGYPSPCTRCKRRVEDHYER